MLAALNAAAAGTIVVLHACCHNPTGCDLARAVGPGGGGLPGARDLVPFLDMAYQGFGEGIAEDGAVIGQFVAAGVDFFVSTSFSEELLALRRAGRRAQRRLRERRGCARCCRS